MSAKSRRCAPHARHGGHAPQPSGHRAIAIAIAKRSLRQDRSTYTGPMESEPLRGAGRGAGPGRLIA